MDSGSTWGNGTGRRNLLQRIDIKNAFRQVGVAPDRAATFAYRLGDLIFADLSLQFGWRESPGRWGIEASTI